MNTFIPRIKILSEQPKPCARRSLDDQIVDLKRMYAKLRWTWTDSSLIVPLHQKGIDRLLVFADTRFTNNQLFGICNNSFSSWRYADDLDSSVPATADERHPSRGPYAIWVKDRDAPDPDLMDLHTKIIKERGIRTLTLLERQFFELVYYRETGRHLDTKKTFTLCSGSCNYNGEAPYARCYDHEFKIGWYSFSLKYSASVARRVITF